MSCYRWLLPGFLASCLVFGAPQQTSRDRSYNLDVPGNLAWKDTGIEIKAGDSLTITASGSVQYSLAPANGPDGLSRGFKDLLRMLPLNEAGRGALIARIGSGDAGEPFLAGSRRQRRASITGRLYLGINQQSNEMAEGSFHVHIDVTGAAPSLADPKQPDSTPTIGTALLDKLPSRVADRDGNFGDRVNFLILGSEDRMKQTFEAAGWVPVDRTKKEAVLHGIMASISKQAYTQMPVSELYLFGRPQDYGYAHAEPFAVVASRHHLRLWKAPFDVDGQTLWVGAATHDIGFERDQRNGKLTHKIDPAVDDEREYVGRTLNETSLVGNLSYVVPAKPVTEANTATGASFHSDGKTMVLSLTATPERDLSKTRSILFRAAAGESGHGRVGGAGRKLRAISGDSLDAPVGSNAFDVEVPSVDCPRHHEFVRLIRAGVSGRAEAPDGNARHDRGTLAVPNNTSEVNAQAITEYLREHMKADSPKYIVLGYSKGAPDLQVALATEPDAASAVAAFITVAGAVGGSPIADFLPAQADRWIRLLHMGNCEGDMAAGFRSLQRSVRQAFLASYPNPVVPTYSLIALSDKTNTSKMLLESWQLLSIYDSNQDSQLTKRDAIVPGAVYLGAARADHLAIALPLAMIGDLHYTRRGAS